MAGVQNERGRRLLGANAIFSLEWLHTWGGRGRAFLRARGEHFCSHQQVLPKRHQAGLTPLRAVLISRGKSLFSSFSTFSVTRRLQDFPAAGLTLRSEQVRRVVRRSQVCRCDESAVDNVPPVLRGGNSPNLPEHHFLTYQGVGRLPTLLSGFVSDKMGASLKLRRNPNRSHRMGIRTGEAEFGI